MSMTKAERAYVQDTIDECNAALDKYKRLSDEMAAGGPREISYFKMELDKDAQKMRLLFAESKDTKPLMFMEMNAPYVYDFAHMLLQGYDKLEGIK